MRKAEFVKSAEDAFKRFDAFSIDSVESVNELSSLRSNIRINPGSKKVHQILICILIYSKIQLKCMPFTQ